MHNARHMTSFQRRSQTLKRRQTRSFPTAVHPLLQPRPNQLPSLWRRLLRNPLLSLWRNLLRSLRNR